MRTRVRETQSYRNISEARSIEMFAVKHCKMNRFPDIGKSTGRCSCKVPCGVTKDRIFLIQRVLTLRRCAERRDNRKLLIFNWIYLYFLISFYYIITNFSHVSWLVHRNENQQRFKSNGKSAAWISHTHAYSALHTHAHARN